MLHDFSFISTFFHFHFFAHFCTISLLIYEEKRAPKKDSKQEKSAQNESKSKPQESVTEVPKTAVPKTIVPKKSTIKKKYKTSGSSAFLKPVYEPIKGEGTIIINIS